MKVTWCLVFVIMACLAVVFALPMKSSQKKDRNNKTYKVVCYYSSWSVYRRGNGKFSVEDINPFLCTHLIYAFAGLGSDNKLRVIDEYLDLYMYWGSGYMRRFNALRKVNPHLTSMLAIGGSNEGNLKYSEMARDPTRRKIFVDSAVSFLLIRQFDGLDISWQFPASRDGIPQDKENFVALLQDLRTAFDEHGLLLTVAVSKDKAVIDKAYDIPKISELVDFVNLMSYDFHNGWETVTGHSSPLYPRPVETGDRRNQNMDWAVQYWLSNGCPKNKLVPGVSAYGVTFTLLNPDNNGLDNAVASFGRETSQLEELGILGYNEICEAQSREPWTVVWNEHHVVPYAFKDDQWVGYDDVQSIGFKAEYVEGKDLAGIMIWSMETDDFRGLCGSKFPLLSKINCVLFGDRCLPTVRGHMPVNTAINGDRNSSRM